VPVPVVINLSQIFLLLLCVAAFCCYFVRFQADIFAALCLILSIAVFQAIGIAHFSSADKNYLTPFLFITSLLIAPSTMILVRTLPQEDRDRIVPRVVRWVLTFLVIECITRFIFSPHMNPRPETDLTDAFYRYKDSLFFVDSNFVGIEILCLLAIMFAYRKKFDRSQWLLTYLLLFATLSRASIAAGICQLLVYILWRWRGWTLIGLLAAQALVVAKLFLTYTTQGSSSISAIDGSFSSKFLILARMAASYTQADAVQKFFGVGVGDSINLIEIFAHNIVATLVLELGIGGSLLFVAYVWILSRKSPASIYLLVLPTIINGFSLVSTSMPFFFAALGLFGALRGSQCDEISALKHDSPHRAKAGGYPKEHKMNPAEPKLQMNLGNKQIYQCQIDAIRGQAQRLGRPLSILEAGCGTRWPLNLAGVDFKLTGVDLDPVAMELRRTIERDLDVTICGDLCTIELPPASYDVVYSAFVLEHVPRADLALENTLKWLKPGGLLILHLPERESVPGFYARILPFWTHVWVYRHLYGKPFAGQPGHAPYPTFYHPVIGRKQLSGFLEAHGMKVLNCNGHIPKNPFKGLLRVLQHWLFGLTKMLSFGNLTLKYGDIVYIAVRDVQEYAQNCN
jgi:SAM-dependent methyltransferase